MHILIIGGGVIGLSTAWQLAKRGQQVTLIEKNTCGSGASTVAPGALMPYNPSRIDDVPLLQRESLTMYPAFIQALEEDSGLPAGYTRNGRLQPIQSAHHLAKIEKDVEIAQEEWPTFANKPAMEILTPEQSLQLEPNLIPTEWGTLYCRFSGHVNTPQLIEALVLACKKHGVNIIENTEVADLTTAKQTYRADKILVAAGAWSSLLTMPEAIHPLKGQVIELETKEPVLGKAFIRAKGLYIVQATPEKIIIGATKEPNAGFDTTSTDKATQKILTKAYQVIPALEKCPVTASYCGLRPASTSGKAVMEQVSEDTYLSSGHGGIGICMTPIAAKVMADKLTH